MPQFGRPVSDVTIGSWTDQGDGIVNLYQAIDEIVSEDFNFVRSEQLLGVIGTIGTPLIVTLTDLADPGVDVGLSLLIRAGKDFVVGQVMDLIVELRQDYLHEIDQGILIATLEIFDLSSTPTDFTLNLSEAEAALISDFGALVLRFRPRVGSEA